MIKAIPYLSFVIDSLTETMKSSKASVKNTAILHNLCHLKSILPNVTWWKRIFNYVKRFVEIRNEVVEVNSYEDGIITINKSQQFLVKARKYGAMLSQINLFTKTLQTELYSLADFRFDLDELTAAVEEARTDATKKVT